MLSEEAKRTRNNYIREYNKENKKIFSARLKNEDYNFICELLKEKKMNKAEFIRYAAEKLKEGKI